MFIFRRLCFWLLLSLLNFQASLAQHASFDTTLILMGTRFEMKAVAASLAQSRDAVINGIDEVKRIEALISSHRSGTDTWNINQNAGISPVTVDQELFGLIVRSIKVSRLTDGAFDITFGPLYNVWKFDGSLTSLPPKDSVDKYQRLTGFSKIELDKENYTVFLPERGMSAGFGAIGKGYAANMAKKVMVKKGAVGGFANASGDVLFWGLNENGEKWKVAIASPFNRDEVAGTLEVENMAVVTSGNYEKNFKIGGETFSHIIDPKTGYPVEDAVSVTVICPDAELADALSTGVSVLGVDEGLKLINQLPRIECFIIDSSGNLHQSENLFLNFAGDNN